MGQIRPRKGQILPNATLIRCTASTRTASVRPRRPPHRDNGSMINLGKGSPLVRNAARQDPAKINAPPRGTSGPIRTLANHRQPVREHHEGCTYTLDQLAKVQGRTRSAQPPHPVVMVTPPREVDPSHHSRRRLRWALLESMRYTVCNHPPNEPDWSTSFAFFPTYPLLQNHHSVSFAETKPPATSEASL